MKNSIHYINLIWSVAQVPACMLLIGFYSLPFLGIFQTLIMLYFILQYNKMERKERLIFQSYWGGYLLYFALLLVIKNINIEGYELPLLTFYALFTLALMTQCVRFTYFITEKNTSK